MAVQAQSPVYLHFPEFHVRLDQQLYASEINDLMPLKAFADTNFQDSPSQSAAPGAESKHLQFFDTLANVDSLRRHENKAFFCGANSGVAGGSVTESRKRPRVYSDVSSLHREKAIADFSLNHGSQDTSPSTGLSLIFQDEKLKPSIPPSNGRMRRFVPTSSTFIEDLLPQLSQQKEEIDEFIKNQEEQFKRILHQKRQQHSRAILTVIEGWLARTLCQKELELKKMYSKNAELEEKIKSLFQQACAWQNRAKFNETMIFALRSNLQQAVAISREQIKEGCGDSHQVNDAESSYIDDTADAKARAFKENKQLKEQRSCKVCRSNDVSVLLLPCRHLCLCKECDVTLDSCPLCRCFKSASVQVYLT